VLNEAGERVHTPSYIASEHERGTGPTGYHFHLLREHGIPISAITHDFAGRPNFICEDRVVLIGNMGFEFARHCKDQSSAVPALTFLARDVIGCVADIVAWHVASGRLVTWIRRVALLGEEEALRPRIDPHLLVHPDPFAWLRAGRRGVVVVDPRMASSVLENAGPFCVASVEQGQALRDMLMRSAPEIFVPASALEAA
jgi:hypothetical protein